MRRRVPHPIHRPKLDHFPKIHHQYPVGNVAHHIEIVADEQIGQSELALEIDQEVEHLCFD